jgi:pectin methylesterase-like acyl-CoA thioesterase
MRECYSVMYVSWAQYYDTVRAALTAASASRKCSRLCALSPLILIHAGTYRDECLVVDSECTIIGAGWPSCLDLSS